MDRPAPGEVRVLYVDADGQFAERAVAVLESESDLTVTTAATAERAGDILASEDVDCVVSAQALPDTNGLAFLESVQEAHPDVPFVLFAHDEGERADIAMEVLDADRTAFLPKRDSREQLERLATRVRSVATFARMQRYLRERRIPFRALVEYSTDLVTVLEPDGTIAYASPSATYLFGYAPTELVGRRAFSFVHPDDRTEVERRFEETLTSPDPVPAIEHRLRHSDGSWRVAESRASNKLEHPAIEGLVVNTRTITARKRMEERLRENKAKIERLHGTATELSACGTQRAICERTVTAAEEVLEFDTCVVDIAEDGDLPTVASTGLPADGTPTLSVSEGLAGKTYRTGQSYLVEDVRERDDVAPQGTYLSAISVPVGDHGVFQAASTQVGAFEQDDLELAELLVAHAAGALDRVDREATLASQATRLERIETTASTDLAAALADAREALQRARASDGDAPLGDVERAHDRLATLADDLAAIARGE